MVFAAAMLPTPTGGEDQISPADLGPSGGFGEHARLCLIQTWRFQMGRKHHPSMGVKKGPHPLFHEAESQSFNKGGKHQAAMIHKNQGLGCPMMPTSKWFQPSKKCWKSRFPMFGNHRTICLDQITLIRLIQPMEILTSIIAHPRKNSMPTWQTGRSEVKDSRKTMLLLSL